VWYFYVKRNFCFHFGKKSMLCCVVLCFVVSSTVQRATKLEFHMTEGNIITRVISHTSIFVLWLCSYIAGLSANAGGPHFSHSCPRFLFEKFWNRISFRTSPVLTELFHATCKALRANSKTSSRLGHNLLLQNCNLSSASHRTIDGILSQIRYLLVESNVTAGHVC